MQIKYLEIVGGAFVLLAAVSNIYPSEFYDTVASEKVACCMRLHKIANLGISQSKQEKINRALISAVGNDDKIGVDKLLNLPEKSIRPDQQGVNLALYEAIRNNNQSIIELMINQPEGSLIPDQQGINSALCKATRKDNEILIKCLLNRSDGQLQPDQQGINLAVSIAAIHGYTEQFKWFFKGEKEGRICPNQAGINRAYRLAVSAERYKIAEWLRPQVSAEVNTCVDLKK